MAPRVEKARFPAQLSRREREIMEALYRLGRATAQEVQQELTDAPGYSAVRKLLSLLEGKRLVRHTKDGRRYVFQPTVPPADASRSALARVVRTFFRGNTTAAMAALIASPDASLSDAELREIERLARQARTEGR